MKEEEHTEQKKKQKEFTKADLQQRLYKAQEMKLLAKEQQKSQQSQLDNIMGLNEVNSNNVNQKVANSQNALGNQNASVQMSSVEENLPKNENVNNVETPRAIMEPNIDTNQQEKSPVKAPNVIKLKQDEPALNKADNYTYVPSSAVGKDVQQSSKSSKQDNYTYIPSPESGVKNPDEQTTVNKYIPSQRAANIDKTYDNSGLEAALRRADKAEQQAIQILSGNYKGM
jgi:hypothetical protein